MQSAIWTGSRLGLHEQSCDHRDKDLQCHLVRNEQHGRQGNMACVVLPGLLHMFAECLACYPLWLHGWYLQNSGADACTEYVMAGIRDYGVGVGGWHLEEA